MPFASLFIRELQALDGVEMAMITEVEERLGRQIVVASRPDFHLEHFELSAIDRFQKTVGRNSRRVLRGQ